VIRRNGLVSPLFFTALGLIWIGFWAGCDATPEVAQGSFGVVQVPLEVEQDSLEVAQAPAEVVQSPLEVTQVPDDVPQVPPEVAQDQEISQQDRAPTRVAIAGFNWHTDYNAAYQQAKRNKQMLLVDFVRSDDNSAQREFQKFLETNVRVQSPLRLFVLARLPIDYEIDRDGATLPLMDDAMFKYLLGQQGIAIIDLKHPGKPYFGDVVSAFPFASYKYYSWKNEYLPEILELPPGTITQRTMVWAVRTHPERPASTTGHHDLQLASAAAQHSQYQANIGVQGHHRWQTRSHKIRETVGATLAKEVVAESWPDQNMIDSCIDCIDSWRHSSGHWKVVRSHHRRFGYDIRRGRNHIWYGTGIFSN
jgi:hypothetical protein